MSWMVLLQFASLILLVLYAYRINLYARAFPPKPSPVFPGENRPMVSVIIPARNEAKHIRQCIEAVLHQRYPQDKLEVIVVDDQSEDETSALAATYPVAVVKSNPLPGAVAFKKHAIATGISHARGEIILTTDADCVVPPGWAEALVSTMMTQGYHMVAGPVKMKPGNNFLSRFQCLDFSILQGITAAALSSGMHDMSSGASLAYVKNCFLEVGGFEGIDGIASGDDMLLMQKFSARYPGKIGYAFTSDAIVETETEKTWQSFFRQRIRWASKATQYKNPVLFRILLLVYLFNCVVLLWLIAGIFSVMAAWTALALVLLKILLEWRFVSGVLRFFGLRSLLPWFPFAQPFHILYTVISGFFGQMGSYYWKGRKVK